MLSFNSNYGYAGGVRGRFNTMAPQCQMWPATGSDGYRLFRFVLGQWKLIAIRVGLHDYSGPILKFYGAFALESATIENPTEEHGYSSASKDECH